MLRLRFATALVLAGAALVWMEACGRVDLDAISDPNPLERMELAASGCGIERWSVKTGTDPDASRVSSTVTHSSIAALISVSAPANPPANGRVAPQELQTFELRDITLVNYKIESDSDYHLVLSDGSRTMISEIPAPGCVGSSSPFLSRIRAARAAFDARFTATPSLQTANVTATVTGVGFFDRIHGQTGVAPNGIELHPVLSICFGAGCSSGGGTTNDFSIAVAPSSQTLRRGSPVSYSVATSVTAGSAQSIRLSVRGLPQGVTGAFTPATVIGGGSSTLRLNASSTARATTATFTVTGAGTSATHTANSRVVVR